MTAHQKGVVINYGFECLLKFEKTEIPSCFIQWLAGCVDTASSQIIVVDEKVIPISKESVHYVLGLPNRGLTSAQDNDALILSRFNLSEMPHITFFGNKLKSGDVCSHLYLFLKSGRHHFFPHIGEKVLNYKEGDTIKAVATSFLGAATSSRKKRLDLSDRLFSPLVIGAHWLIFSVDFEYGLLAFMDSFYDKDSHFHTSIRDRLIENFIKLWELIFNSREHNFRTFKKMYPHVPQQQNADDCCVFGMKIMEVWNPLVDLRKIFSSEDIPHIRIQYMTQMFFWARNNVDKSLVTDFQFEGDFVDN